MPALVALAAAGHAGTLVLAEPARLPALCGAVPLGAVPDLALLVARFSSPAAIAFAWFLMIAAMMPPLLADPIVHVSNSSFRGRRARSVTLFAAGYGAMWFGAGLLLVPMAIAIQLILPGGEAALIALAAAALWSASPAAQVARNRCHRRRRIGAFGRAADGDCLRQGFATGAACASACWPWMLVPMVIGHGHVAAMAAVTILLFAERLAPPADPVWRLPPAAAVAAALLRAQKVAGRP